MGVRTDTPQPATPSSRHWRNRGRLAVAVMASLLVHWLLQQGLARTAIDVRPLDRLFPEKEPSYRPDLASDFPLRDDSTTRESYAHERPLDVPIAVDAAAPVSARQIIREGEPTVEDTSPAEVAESPDVSVTRIDRPALDVAAAEPESVREPERSDSELPASSTAAEALSAVIGDEADTLPPVPRRERPGAVEEPAVALEGLPEAADDTLFATSPMAPPLAVSPRRFTRGVGDGDDAPALPGSLRRAEVGDTEARIRAPATVELPTRTSDDMEGSRSAGGVANADGPPVAVAPRRRPPVRIADRGQGGFDALRRPTTGEGSDDGLSAGLSATEIPSGAAGLRPRRTPPAGATETAGPAPPATPLLRARTLLLPAETRVRETAEAFARRSRENRGASKADALVERGLEWLASVQKEDGHWSLGAYDPNGAAGTVRLQSDTAATGLALLAFLGAGYDHFDGRHRDVVRRGLEWLVSVQKADGDLYVTADPVSNSCAWLYSHGIATTVLCEAVGMTGDPLLRPSAERAIGFIVASQQPSRGGWRYQPRADSDLSVSGWMLVALRAGVLAGLDVPAETFAGVERLLDGSAIADKTGSYHYNAINPGQRPSDLSAASMTALGALMRLHGGTPRTDEGIVTAAGRLAAMTPAYGTRQARTRDAYLWYYASQVLVQTGGPEWDAWYERLCVELETQQVAAGRETGSWDPLGQVPDRWGAFGGRLYVTALHLLALEVPYRHLPTYGVTGEARR